MRQAAPATGGLHTSAGVSYGFQTYAGQAAGHLPPIRLFTDAATSNMAEQLQSGSMGISRQDAEGGMLLSSSSASVGGNMQQAQADMVTNGSAGAALQHRTHASPNAARLAFAR